MSKIKWGELGNYLPIDLLEKTNVDEFITQEIVDSFNMVLSGKNPDHKKGDFREWDYAEFKTENGGYFNSFSILNPLLSTTAFDETYAEITYRFNGEFHTIKGINYKNHYAIKLVDESSKLYYEVADDEISYSHEGDKFTISGVELPQLVTNK